MHSAPVVPGEAQAVCIKVLKQIGLNESEGSRKEATRGGAAISFPVSGMDFLTAKDRGTVPDTVQARDRFTRRRGRKPFRMRRYEADRT